MKTVPHIVEEKHLRLFHPVSHSVNVKRVPPRRKAPRKATAQRAPPRKTKKVPVKRKARKAAKKTIKGRVIKRSRQSKVRRQGGNFKDIFTR